MKIKRISTSETVSIEDGFFWSDEFSWKAKEQSLEYAMDGTLIIQEGTKLSGRPITLVPADSGMGVGFVKCRPHVAGLVSIE